MQSVLIKNLHSKPFIFLLKKFKGVQISICQSQDGAMHLTHHLFYTVQCFNCTVTLAFQWNKWWRQNGVNMCVYLFKASGEIWFVIIYVAILPLWLLSQGILHVWNLFMHWPHPFPPPFGGWVWCNPEVPPTPPACSCVSLVMSSHCSHRDEARKKMRRKGLGSELRGWCQIDCPLV